MMLDIDQPSVPSSRLDALRARAGRPLRFVVAGAFNTAFGLAIFPLLLWCFVPLRSHYLVALAIAQATSLCFAFAVYKLGVFQTRRNMLREFGAFSSFYLVVFCANWLALPLLVEAARLPPIPAQVGFSLLVMVTSYFWHSRFTFRSKR